jgi:hypothetical protein
MCHQLEPLLLATAAGGLDGVPHNDGEKPRSDRSPRIELLDVFEAAQERRLDDILGQCQFSGDQKRRPQRAGLVEPHRRLEAHDFTPPQRVDRPWLVHTQSISANPEEG